MQNKLSDNDIIAEYVKERYPEILLTLDFTVFKFNKALQNLSIAIGNSLKCISREDRK